MTGALIILVFTVLVGLVLYIIDRARHPRTAEETQEDEVPQQGEPQGECCGQHIVCEKDTLSPFTTEIVYYDDEELDRFRGRTANDYDNAEIEEFREVLMTLLPQDLAGWGRSITARGIELPLEIRDEFLLLIADQRTSRHS